MQFAPLHRIIAICPLKLAPLHRKVAIGSLKSARLHCKVTSHVFSAYSSTLSTPNVEKVLYCHYILWKNLKKGARPDFIRE